MNIKLIDNDVSCCLLVKPDTKTFTELLNICQLIAEDVETTMFCDAVKVNLKSKSEYKEMQDKLTFACDNYNKIIDGISRTDNTFDDYYKHPELLSKQQHEDATIVEPKKNKTSEKQLQHIRNYLAKFKEIKVRVTEDFREEVKEHAAKKGMSVNEYIINLIKNDMGI